MTDSFLTFETLELAYNLMDKLNCPRSLTIKILIREREWVQLFSMKCKPSDYSSAEDYLRATAATDFLRKLNVDASVPGIDPDRNAFLTWMWAEKECFITNCKLYEIVDFDTLDGAPVPDALNRFIDRLRENVRLLIGNDPGAYQNFGRFGPGATISDNYGATTVAHKMSSAPTLTPSALYHLVPWTGTRWASACAERGDVITIVHGNKYFAVNKTFLTRRPCAKEASVNAYFQLGLGSVMRRRLKRSGIDLDHGQDVHRRVACSSSFSGESCTIDLTSASDTLCLALVKLAFPPAWYAALSDLRAPITFLPGEMCKLLSNCSSKGDENSSRGYRLEKFSSMGNGFTFELETVTFAALCMTACPDLIPGWNMWVYGDDIIVPKESFREVISTLRFFGFTPNLDKTFNSGSFRESCGGDFFLGEPVRAYFLKEQPYEPQHYISIANGLRRLALQLGKDSRLWADLRGVWFRCLDYLPSHIKQCRGPEALGDLCIHDEPERWCTRSRANGIRYVRVYRPLVPEGLSFARFDSAVQMACALYGVELSGNINDRWPEGFDNRELIGRDPKMSYKVGWLPFS